MRQQSIVLLAALAFDTDWNLSCLRGFNIVGGFFRAREPRCSYGERFDAIMDGVGNVEKINHSWIRPDSFSTSFVVISSRNF